MNIEYTRQLEKVNKLSKADVLNIIENKSGKIDIARVTAAKEIAKKKGYITEETKIFDRDMAVLFIAAANSSEHGQMLEGLICSNRNRGSDGVWYYGIKVKQPNGKFKQYWKQEKSISSANS